MVSQDFGDTDIVMTDSRNIPDQDEPVEKGAVDKGGKKKPYRTGAQKIVVDTVTQCGGAYPGNNEMWYPFATAWKKLYDADPQRPVCQRAVQSALNSGKLKKIVFAFQDKMGLTVEGKLLILPEQTSTSAAAQAMKRAMIEAHPLQHVPEEAEVSTEIRSSARMVANAKSKPAPNPSELKAVRESEAVKSTMEETLDKRFPVIEGLQVQRTTAAVQLAQGDYRVLGFGKSRLVKRSYTKSVYPVPSISDVRNGRYVPPGANVDRGMGRLLNISRLNQSGVAIRKPLRPVNTTREPLGLGYLPSLLAHSILDPTYLALEETTQLVQRKKPGPKPKFLKAAAIKLTQSGCRMLMNSIETFHSPSGTFGTSTIMERSQAALTRSRQRELQNLSLIHI